MNQEEATSKTTTTDHEIHPEILVKVMCKENKLKRMQQLINGGSLILLDGILFFAAAWFFPLRLTSILGCLYMGMGMTQMRIGVQEKWNLEKEKIF
jgi:hypothetical protein